MPELKEETREVARALLAVGKSYRQVAEALEISVGTVHNIAREPRGDIEPLVRELKGRMAMKYWLIASHIMATINDRNLRNATLKEKAIAAAIFTDKAVALERLGAKLAPDPAGEEPEEAVAEPPEAGSPEPGHLNANEHPLKDATPCFESIKHPPRGF